MFKVGYLDDEYDVLKSARRSLKKKDIELIALEEIKDVSDIDALIESILNNAIQCLLVDYDLMKLNSKMVGTKVIKQINSLLPDFTCFLLTNFTEQGINEKLVQKIFVQDKSIFAEDDDSDEFNEFITKIKNSIECFEKRLEINKEEYSSLLEKKKENTLTSIEEEKFELLYKVLSSYQYVDPLPTILLKNNTQIKLDELLDTLENFKASLKKGGGDE